MEKEKLKKLISSYLEKGHSISQIQEILKDKHSYSITFIDLRLLSSEIDFDWKKLDPKPKKEKEEVKKQETPSPGEDKNSLVSIEINKVNPTGALFSGRVDFTSGAKANWSVSSMGQLAFDLKDDNIKPTDEEMQEFQKVLTKKLQG